MRRMYYLLTIPCVALLPLLLLYESQTNTPYVDEFEFAGNGSANSSATRANNAEGVVINCVDVLEQFDPPTDAVLIDIDLLRAISDNQTSCQMLQFEKILIGVGEKLWKAWKGRRRDSRFDVVFYEDLPDVDYWTFYTKPRRIVPKIRADGMQKVGEGLHVPLDAQRFIESWRRSRLVECSPRAMNRSDTPAYLSPESSTASLAGLRDLLLDFGMVPALNGGTLLGWYRECSVIPHTWDMDVSVQANTFNPLFVNYLLKNTSSEFRVKRILGDPKDGFELTVVERGQTRPAIDVFFMYDDAATNTSWVGGTGPRGEKFKYSYPLYDPFCAADLHGHIFWVTCRPLLMLRTEYGEKWYEDFPTKKFSWSSSQFNVARSGNWRREDMKRVYRVFN